MSSQITPNSINQNYPVAGVDNNSQGFRDNFTSIKNNFTITAREINDLMDKVVVKAPLTYGSTPSATNNNFADAVIETAALKDCSLVTAADRTISSSDTLTINYSDGSFQKITLSGSSITSTLAFTNFPPSGKYGEVRVRFYVTDVSHTVTLPAAVSLFDRALTNYNQSTRIITFPSTSAYYDFVFSSSDAGSSIAVQELINKPEPIIKYLTSNVTTTSTSFGNVTGLTFTALANQTYKFEVLLPITHSASSTDTHSFAMGFSAGTCRYVVEQQAGPDSAFTANSAIVTDSTAGTVTTSSTSVKFAKISGVFTHTAATDVSVRFKTSAGTLTVVSGASFTATQLGY